MAEGVDLASVNPFKNFSIGGMGTMANILLVIAIAVLILLCLGFFIYWWYIRKVYYIKLHVFRLVGNIPTRVAIYTAREVPFGMAGDKLWKVAPAGVWKIMIVKWLPVGKFQTAPNEFWYWIREDGEWINFVPTDIDESSHKMNVKFVQEDMRLQRLATDRLLEQRHMEKSFWDRWQNTIMTILVFLVVAICMVIIFYQFSKILDKFGPLLSNLNEGLRLIKNNCYGGNATSLIPA
jgi:hypothetical protein